MAFRHAIGAAAMLRALFRLQRYLRLLLRDDLLAMLSAIIVDVIYVFAMPYRHARLRAYVSCRYFAAPTRYVRYRFTSSVCYSATAY